jgi:hypothetical protein
MVSGMPREKPIISGLAIWVRDITVFFGACA